VSRKSNESKYSLKSASAKMDLVCVPEAQFQALSRPDSAPPVPGMENPKRLILLGGGLSSTSLGPEFGPLRELLQDFPVEGAEDLRLAPPRGHGRGRDPGDHGEDDEGDGHVRLVDLYKQLVDSCIPTT
jgi:hypothetical protein